MTGWTAADGDAMDRALALARRALGTTAPNPSVGCVIVVNGDVIAEGATGAGGRPHAEETALALLGGRAPGATAYVTLEPCAARSDPRAPSCAQRLRDGGVARVVIACPDPHPNAAGEGVAILRAAGVDVEEGLRGAEADALNAGFFHRVRTGRPLVLAEAGTAGFDADLSVGGWLDPSGDLTAQLQALGERGFNRVRVDPKAPLAQTLKAAGLLGVRDSA